MQIYKVLQFLFMSYHILKIVSLSILQVAIFNNVQNQVVNLRKMSHCCTYQKYNFEVDFQVPRNRP